MKHIFQMIVTSRMKMDSMRVHIWIIKYMQNETEGPEFFSQFTGAIFTHSFKKNTYITSKSILSHILLFFSFLLESNKKIANLMFCFIYCFSKNSYLVIWCHSSYYNNNWNSVAIIQCVHSEDILIELKI